MSSLDKIPVKSNELSVRELGTNIIIISESGKELHTLDDIGSFIWKVIDGHSTVTAILNKICDEYDVDMSRAKSDLLSYLKELSSKGLIKY